MNDHEDVHREVIIKIDATCITIVCACESELLQITLNYV